MGGWGRGGNGLQIPDIKVKKGKRGKDEETFQRPSVRLLPFLWHHSLAHPLVPVFFPFFFFKIHSSFCCCVSPPPPSLHPSGPSGYVKKKFKMFFFFFFFLVAPANGEIAVAQVGGRVGERERARRKERGKKRKDTVSKETKASHAFSRVLFFFVCFLLRFLQEPSGCDFPF